MVAAQWAVDMLEKGRVVRFIISPAKKMNVADDMFMAQYRRSLTVPSSWSKLCGL
ncbi:MAG: hypothetical protein MEEGG_02875 [Eggerthella lenta]